MYGSFARMSDAGSIAPSVDSSIQIIPAPPPEPVELVVLDAEGDDVEMDVAGGSDDDSDETDPSEDPDWTPAVVDAPQPIVPAAPLAVRPVRAIRDFPDGCAGPSRPVPAQSDAAESPFRRQAHAEHEPAPVPHIHVPAGMRLLPIPRGRNGWISDDSDDESVGSVGHMLVPEIQAAQEEPVAPMLEDAPADPIAPPAPEPLPQEEPAPAALIHEGSPARSSELHRAGLEAFATASPPTPPVVVSTPEWATVSEPLIAPLAEPMPPPTIAMTIPIPTIPSMTPAPYPLGAGDPYLMPHHFSIRPPSFLLPHIPVPFPFGPFPSSHPDIPGPSQPPRTTPLSGPAWSTAITLERDFQTLADTVQRTVTQVEHQTRLMWTRMIDARDALAHYAEELLSLDAQCGITGDAHFAHRHFLYERIMKISMTISTHAPQYQYPPPPPQ